MNKTRCRKISFLLILAMLFVRFASDCVFAAQDVEISAMAKSGSIGNNFFSDDMPVFDIRFAGDAGEYHVNYRVVNSNEEEVWSLSESISIGSAGELTKEVAINKKYYGKMKLRVNVTDGTSTSAAEIPYTLSNITSDIPKNKRMGVSTHISRGRGTPDANFELISRAGIGNIRGEDFYWSSFETKEGEYSLTPMHKKLLSLISRYDMDYMFLCSSGNPIYKGKADDLDIAPPSTPEGYNALENYISKLLELTDGKIKSVEVWNEYHNSDFSGGYNKNPQVHANLHRYIYNGVQSYNQKYNQDVSAVGFAEDWWGFGVTTAVDDCLKELNGEKYFDCVSLHPYAGDLSKPFETDAQVKNLLSKAGELLVANGYSKNIPRIFSELGWDDYSLSYDQEKKAAYTVRAHAYAQANDLADIVYNYAFTDYLEYLETSPVQAGFGMVESYDSSRVEVPYLGKPVYVALSYWNNLMADNTFVKSIETDIENGYCYLFKDRYDRDILMYGMYDDNASVKYYLGCNSNKVTAADMYGNEKDLVSANASYELEFTDKPQYIIGELENASITDKPTTVNENYAKQIGENRIQIGGKLGNKSGRYTVKVFAPGKNGSDIDGNSDSKNTDSLVYINQGMTDENGVYQEEFNVHGEGGLYNVVIYSEELEKREDPISVFNYITDEIAFYDFKGNKLKYVVKGDKIKVRADLVSNNFNNKNPIIICALYDGNVLVNVEEQSVLINDGNREITLTLTVPNDLTDPVLKGFVWEDMSSLKPLIPSATIE